MDIHKIIYDNTRNLLNIEDKLNIAVLFIFCYKLKSSKFADLLYTDNHKLLVDQLNYDYEVHEIKFNINLSDKEVNESFKLVLDAVIKQEDKDGYYKALFNKDEYALAIENIVDYNFDNIKFKKLISNISEQLKFNF